MKDIIIDRPELQSFQQRCGSAFLAVMSWLLWLYFLLPLFTLSGWLMGLKSLSDEIRWFGGYKTLLELLGLYGAIILSIAAIWLAWVTFLLLRSRASAKPVERVAVSEPQLAKAFNVQLATLAAAKQQQKLTVHFDQNALITRIDQD